MTIAVECSNCGKKYRVADERAGQTLDCKDCGEEIEIPGGRRRRNDDDAAPTRKRSGKKKNSKSAGGAPAALIGLGIGAVVVVAGVVAMFAFRRAPNVAEPGVNPMPGGVAAQPDAAPGAAPVPGPAANPAQNPTPPVAANPGVTNPALTKAAGSGFKGGADQGGVGAKFEFQVKNWNFAPDPAPETATYDPSRKFNIKVKDGYISDESVTYPETPSPFALVSDPDSKGAGRNIWNLATATKAGAIQGQRMSGKTIALSPDGKYVAWHRFEATGGIVEVWDVAAKKSLGGIAVDPKKFNMSVLAIPSPKRMVAFSDVHNGLLSWKLPSGDLEREQGLGDKSRPGDRYAFSPGGRYAAFLRNFLARSVAIYDFETGTIGDLEFTRRPATELLGMAFSPDGQEFALVFDGEQPAYGERIIILKLATGAVVESIQLEAGVKKEHNLHGTGTSLQWFPNGRQLLLHGVAIVDRAAGKVVYSLGKPKLDTGSLRNRRVLDNGLIAAWEGSRQDSTVQPLRVSDDEISRSVAAVESGGLMVDAKLPKLTRFDMSQATDRTDDKSPGWQVSVDPAAAGSPLLATPLALQGSGQVRGLSVSRLDPGLAFVRMAEGEDPTDLRNRQPEVRFRVVKDLSVIAQPRTRPIHCQKNWVNVYDLAKRESVRQIPIDFSCELLSASPNGARILVAPHDGEGRVDVYSATDGTHLAGFRPFQAESKEEDRGIQSAFFLDADHVAVINFEDRLVVCKLPDCKPVYELKGAVSPTLSPGGKVLAVALDNRVELRDPATGAPKGNLELGGPVRALAFHPAGERLAAVSYERKGWYLHEIDVKAGRAAEAVPLPVSVLSCHWCGDDYLLLNNAALFDVKQRTVAWTYETADPDGIHVAMPPDGRHWMAARRARGAAVQIVAAELPDAAAKTKLSGARLEPRMVVQPGGSVTVMAKVPERPDRPGFQAEALGLLNAAVERSGVKDAAGQPVKLAVNVEFKTGNNVPVKFFGTGGQKEAQVQEKSLEILVAYDSNGAVLWKSQNTIANLGSFIRVPSVEAAQQALDDQMWDRARGFLDGLQLPAHLFSQESVYGLGTSILTGDGPQAKGK